MTDAAATQTKNNIHSFGVTPVNSHAITPHASAGTIGDCPSLHAAIAQPRYSASADTFATTASRSNELVIASASVNTD